MISRYATEKMRTLWGDDYKLTLWFHVMRRTAEEAHYVGEDLPLIISYDDVVVPSVKQLAEREAITRHDVAAFVQLISEQLKDEAKEYFYFGLTSSDVVDTAQSIRIHKSGKLTLDAFDKVDEVLRQLIDSTRNTRAVGRTHGRAAESVPMASRFIRILEDINSAQARFCDAVNAASVCMLSGPTGSYSVLGPDIEAGVAQYFNLQPASSLFTTTQVLPRRLITNVVQACASVATAIECGATQIRLLALSEVDEVAEGFGDGQIGSSSMAHKSNPVVSENLCGLARLVRAMVAPTAENEALWFERDISHSSVERVILPDAFALTEHMLLRFGEMLLGLEINYDEIERNLRNAGMQVHSHNLLCWLIEHGFERFEAYRELQAFFRNGVGAGANCPETFAFRFASHFNLDQEEIETEINEIILKG